MKNASIWDACRIYGTNVILPHHNNPELFRRWLDNYQSLETQLLTDTKGERVPGKNKYTDDSGQVWGPVRWPWKANTEEAHFKDYPRSFLFDSHLVAIGSTGWDWQRKEARWVGYDFDALVGHAAGIGVEDSELEEVVKRAPDFVDVVRSTRGKGKHFYICFAPPFPTVQTHTEHAALARAFLPVMAAQAGFDFSTKMDVCGSILWLWHKDATPENQGFTSIQPATQTLTAEDVPPNWKDHLDVVTGGRSRVRVRGWTPKGQTTGDELDEETVTASRIELDEVHQAVLRDLERSGYSFNWVHDHHLAQTHTCAIKKVHTEWVKKGQPLKGPFDTTSPDTDASKVNCYMRPRLNGAWDVFRFGGSVAEHPLWDDLGGKTHITLNVPPSLRQGVLAAGGFECADTKNGFQVDGEEELYEALGYLGCDFRIDDRLSLDGRAFTVKTRGDGRIVLTVTRHKTDPDKDWIGWEKKTATQWQRLLAHRVNTDQDDDLQSAMWDNKIRAVKAVSMAQTGSVAGHFESWMIKDKDGKWVVHPKDHVTAVVGTLGLPAIEAVKVCGNAIDNAWTKVNKPFEPEYPGGREWNYGAPQYTYQPITLKEGEAPVHPYWDRVFNHCGTGLDRYIPELPWCREWGITCGGDYLRAWVASLLRFPYARLPYLFFHSEDGNTGKTTFHESIRLLVTHGVHSADKAITSQGDYNGELENILLGTIDETNIAKAGRAAYNKIKDWTTATTFSLHGKYKQVYEQLNVLHLIQTANKYTDCPIAIGDTRITSIKVPKFKEKVEKEELKSRLREEGPHIMRTLMDVLLPTHTDRMRVPVIETDAKQQTIEANHDPLEAFVDAECTYAAGQAVSFKEFHSVFLESLEPFERNEWSKAEVKRSMPEKYPIGRWNRNIAYVGNLLLGHGVESEDSEGLFILSGGRLVREI